MSYSFPQYPHQKIVLSYFTNIGEPTLDTVKTLLIAANPEYDFCFLNTTHIVSMEHLNNGIYRAIQNYNNNAMKAKTLHTEIMFNLSPVNNIMDAIKRFGVDVACSNLIVVKILSENDDFELINAHLETILASKAVELSDATLYKTMDVAKVKKIYKLNDAVTNDTQPELTRLVISACQLRGL